jgi:hypothetical protein
LRVDAIGSDLRDGCHAGTCSTRDWASRQARVVSDCRDWKDISRSPVNGFEARVAAAGRRSAGGVGT